MANSGKRRGRMLAKDERQTKKASKAKKPKMSNEPSFIDHDCSSQKCEDLLENRQLQTMSSAVTKIAAKQSSTAVTGFQAIVSECKKEISIFLSERARNILQEDACSEAAYVSAIIDSLNHTDPNNVEGRDSSASTKPAWHPAHQTARSSLGSVRKLIQDYESFCEEIALFKGSNNLVKGWNGDFCKLNSLFVSRRKVTKYKVHAHLEIRNTPSEGSHTGARLAAEENLWEIIGGQTKTNDNENPGQNWAVATRRAEKGVRHLVKGLQDDK